RPFLLIVGVDNLARLNAQLGRIDFESSANPLEEVFLGGISSTEGGRRLRRAGCASSRPGGPAEIALADLHRDIVDIQAENFRDTDGVHGARGRAEIRGGTFGGYRAVGRDPDDALVVAGRIAAPGVHCHADAVQPGALLRPLARLVPFLLPATLLGDDVELF